MIRHELCICVYVCVERESCRGGFQNGMHVPYVRTAAPTTIRTTLTRPTQHLDSNRNSSWSLKKKMKMRTMSDGPAWMESKIWVMGIDRDADERCE